MLRDPDAEILRLRTALRDLVALSTIPAAWVGRAPQDIAAGLADVLVGSLRLDFAFVQLCDPQGGASVEASLGNAWDAFPEWLDRRLAATGSLSRREIIPDVGRGPQPCRGIIIRIGVDGEGGLVDPFAGVVLKISGASSPAGQRCMAVAVLRGLGDTSVKFAKL